MSAEDLMRAQGKFVAFLAALLARPGGPSMEEFAALLGLYAVTVSEAVPAEGEILAYWASVVRDAASAGGPNA